MDNVNVKLTTNWFPHGGVDLINALQLDITDQTDNFYKIPLKDIINEDKSILLSKPECEIDSEPCELCIQLTPHYKIQAVHLVCNAIKVEIFQGQIKAYKETIYGELVHDDEEDESNKDNYNKSSESDDLHLTFYRYDVEVEKSGVTQLTVRFLTPFLEVCIFGIRLNAAPNPNGITTLMTNPSININIENVQNMLDIIPNKTLPSVDKYMKFLKIMMKASNSGKPTASSNLSTQQTQSISRNEIDIQQSTSPNVITNIDVNLKNYIDLKFMKLEQSIQQHFTTMEERQENKLAEILNILQTLLKNQN